MNAAASAAFSFVALAPGNTAFSYVGREPLGSFTPETIGTCQTA